jgi:uncharacterized protein (TIGR03067 family)
MYRVALALAVAALCAPAALPDEKPKTDQDRMQGSWKFVTLSVSGRKAPKDYLANVRAVIDGKSFTIKPGVLLEGSNEKPEGEWKVGAKDGDRFTFEVDAAATPKAIDIHAQFDGQKVTLKGIYDLAGDDLKICFAERRPKEFPAEDGSGAVFYVLKRDRK